MADECSNCGCGTLEETEDEFVCLGECGEIWPKLKALGDRSNDTTKEI
jgi:hypothetical protein